VLLRVSRAAWRLEQAERERSWALASARAEGVSIRTLAAAVGLSSSRVHQIVAAADLDELDAALGELRAAGWPAPSPLPLSGLLGLPPLLRSWPGCWTRQICNSFHDDHGRRPLRSELHRWARASCVTRAGGCLLALEGWSR
jgi:hypothetical protein